MPWGSWINDLPRDAFLAVHVTAVQVGGLEDHRVDRGDSVSITFDAPGTYHVCTLHRQDIEGEVTVP